MSQLRRTVTALLAASAVAGALWLVQAPAGAATPTAADLAADCNADGTIVVAKYAQYSGGTGWLTRDCRPMMDPGAQLVLTKVTLLSKCCMFRVEGSGGNHELLVLDSRIDLASALELVAGSRAGEPGAENGHVRVERSSLVGLSVEVGASVGSPRGRVEVVDSRLQSTGHGGQPTINIWASYGDFDGTEGSAYVSGSDLITADRIIIKTGRFGSTAARSNTFSGPGSVVIRTGVGGVCSTFANVPAVPCT